VAAGVAGMSVILKSGWKAVKWRGTSGPRFSANHEVSSSSSWSLSFSPGISSVVTSSHTSVSWWR
jgi:hypothetical protein